MVNQQKSFTTTPKTVDKNESVNKDKFLIGNRERRNCARHSKLAFNHNDNVEIRKSAPEKKTRRKLAANTKNGRRRQSRSTY